MVGLELVLAWTEQVSSSTYYALLETYRPKHEPSAEQPRNGARRTRIASPTRQRQEFYGWATGADLGLSLNGKEFE